MSFRLAVIAILLSRRGGRGAVRRASPLSRHIDRSRPEGGGAEISVTYRGRRISPLAAHPPFVAMADGADPDPGALQCPGLKWYSSTIASGTVSVNSGDHEVQPSP